MTCPRCGQEAAQAPACPRCGVVFAKLQNSARPRPVARPAEPADAPPRGGLSPASFGIALALIVGGAWFVLDRRPRPPIAKSEAAPAAPAAPPASLAGTPAPVAAPASPQAPPVLPASAPPGMSQEDARAADALIQKLVSHARIDESDLKRASDLSARYPSEAVLGDVHASALAVVAASHRAQRRYAEAETLARRAIALRPAQLPPRTLLINVLLETNDFAGAERAARDAAALTPRDADLQFHLGYSLFRQDRNREALEALRESLAIQESLQARSLYDRLQKTARDERGMAEQQLAHFHVRYDGGEHEDVGREILRQLERHYATLVRTFDHQPGSPVPVILFSQEQYYTASGAPAWSGGVFDGMDGRIRIPIGGLTASLSPEMDGTLIHELTHAFIHDMSRGLATREVHEGFAQYMEGHRIATRFKAGDLKIIADGRAGGVAGFYAEALAFVEYLIATRGVGGMNDLLKAMAKTGDVNAAFQQVHGRDYAGTQQAWRERLKQQYGS